ncbi:MAG: CDP-alcohol phosphatidyltransferase family protein [Ekhidna sp.]
MKKHIPNLLTCLNLAIGSVGIYHVLTANGRDAIYFVLVAGAFDFLDGFAARMLNVKSELGKQLDSLSDLVSFGLLPAFFMVQWMQSETEWYWIGISIAIFSALRLAKFNLDETQTDSFIGLPTPANAIMLTSLVLVPFQLYGYTLISICVLSSILLVSPIRLLALKFSSFGWRGNEARWLLIAGILILTGVFGWSSAPMIIPFYILVSIVAFVGKNKGA